MTHIQTKARYEFLTQMLGVCSFRVKHDDVAHWVNNFGWCNAL